MNDDVYKNKKALIRRMHESVADWYREHVDRSTHLPRISIPDYDIVCRSVGNVEVREDRLAKETNYFALETEDFMGRPSGLMTTKAGEFVIVDAEFVVFSSTDNLRYIINKSERRKWIGIGYKTETGKQNHGYLIPRSEILYSPFVRVEPRWFPEWRIINGHIC